MFHGIAAFEEMTDGMRSLSFVVFCLNVQCQGDGQVRLLARLCGLGLEVHNTKDGLHNRLSKH